MTATKLCTACGEDKPLREYRRSGMPRLMPECRSCRDKLRRRSYYRKERDIVERERRKIEMKVAKQKQRVVVESDPIKGILAELRKELAPARFKMRQYQKKIDDGTATERTFEARDYQARRVNYYRDIERFIKAHAQRGLYPPLRFYFTNTKLLYHHGLRASFEQSDPDFFEWEKNDGSLTSK